MVSFQSKWNKGMLFCDSSTQNDKTLSPVSFFFSLYRKFGLGIKVDRWELNIAELESCSQLPAKAEKKTMRFSLAEHILVSLTTLVLLCIQCKTEFLLRWGKSYFLHVFPPQQYAVSLVTKPVSTLFICLHYGVCKWMEKVNLCDTGSPCLFVNRQLMI